MLDAENPTEAPGTEDSASTGTVDDPTAARKTARKATAKKATTKKATAKKAPAKRTTRKVAATPVTPETDEGAPADDAGAEQGEPAAAKKTAKKAAARKTAKKATTKKSAKQPAGATDGADQAASGATAEPATSPDLQAADAARDESRSTPPGLAAPLFQPPDPTKALPRKRSATKAKAAEPTPELEDADADPGPRPAKKTTRKRADARTEGAGDGAPEQPGQPDQPDQPEQPGDQGDEGGDEQGGERRRRRRGGRRRRKSGGGGGEGDNGSTDAQDTESPATDHKGGEETSASDDGDEPASGTRRRRRRRRSGEGDGEESSGSSSRTRKPRSAEDEITSLTGSTRLEAKKQRRREGREAGRRRAPIVSEAEFLARREAVDRVMVIRQRKDLTQIAVLEDKVLVEHYVARDSQTSLIGNVYLGRVQNVLPSMEAAFIDIGKGRNAVLYAGEVNWEALGAKNGTPRKIEAVLKSGQPILVQVTKDPIGHKGARLTSQVSLPGRFLVYVPDGTTSGISRKLPDTERNRLKSLLKEIVPDSAGVIVRTAAEGASEDELTRDVERLTARWSDIEGKVKAGNAPQLLYGEPDLTLKVVRDLFTEDFNKLVIAGEDAWDLVQGYVSHVAPDLEDRLERYDGGDRDVFAEYRIDEQIEKALDRKVWLPSGGSLVIDRTEAMTVVDVNTGKFTGSGGNLEETVTKNNLEAAEEIVRQLRLRDIGGIIVVDFIDMVLESNRDLVLRRMVECLGRDRTRHQVAEVTSLGLVQMTRKRIGTGLLEAFSEACEHCHGRGLVLHHEPVEPSRRADDDRRGGRRGGRGRGRDDAGSGSGSGSGSGGSVPSPKDLAAMARHEKQAEKPAEATTEKQAEKPAEATTEKQAEKPTEATPEEAAFEGTQPEPEPEQPEQPEPAAPTVTRTTRTRRGRVTRPAGTYTPQAVEPVTTPAPESSGGAEPAAAGAPGPAEAEITESAEAPEPAATTEPPAPRVVTTTRRRSARRPAGPPTGAAAAGAEADRVDGVDPSAEVPEEAVGTPHVPVKRKGSRRR